MRDSLKFWRSPLATTFGLLAGMLFGAIWPALWGVALDRYDDSHPVWVDGTAKVVARLPGTIRVELEAQKVRNCRYLRVQAHVSSGRDVPATVAIRRVDQPEVGSTRPLGRQRLGLYDVQFDALAAPTDLRIVTEHDCADRIVVSQLVRVQL